MKTIFEKETRDELIARINALDTNCTAQWGKMTVYQMAKHCALWEEMMLGKRKYKQAFIGRLFGKTALENILKDDAPLRRSTPTLADLKITGNGDLEVQKQQWITLVEEYGHFNNHNFIHPFFGKMTTEQIGPFVYKHTDHHLRQFNS